MHSTQCVYVGEASEKDDGKLKVGLSGDHDLKFESDFLS
jgi:hypothetical protein